MGCFYALNAGKADCLVLQLTVDGQTKTIVVDGGSKKDPRRPLPLFLKELGAPHIDLMILTHIHQDHLGYLQEASETFSVKEAVLPYPPIPLPPDQLEALYSKKQAANMRAYNAFYRSLEGRCRLHTVYPFTGPGRYVYGDYTLTCLYPDPGAISPVWSAYQSILTTPTQNAQPIADQSREWINADSSIWVLEKERQALLLLCGDSLDDNVANSCLQHEVTEVGIIKLSHHGRNDKGKVYFRPETIQALNPHTVVISADETVTARYRSVFDTIAPKAKLLITCEAEQYHRLTV
jgi:beta-lactamase superfamily II metal-dependent hydrolase